MIEAHIAMKTFPNQNKEQIEVELESEEIYEDDDVLFEWGTTETEEVEVFCICRQPENGRLMICCDECDEWFHADCIDLSEKDKETYKNNPDIDFICPFCD